MVKLSPLVTTVLLLIVSGSLGAVVMSWGQEYIEERAEFVERPPSCADVSFGIVTVQGSQTLCHASHMLSLFLENTGDAGIDGFRTVVLGAADVVEQNHPGMGVDDIEAFIIDYDREQLGPPQQLRILPQIGGQTCRPGLVVEHISPCP